MFNFFPLQVLLHQVYLLQLEEYSVTRYLRLISKTKGISSRAPRKNIEWTQKLLLVFLFAIGLQLLVALGLGWFFNNQIQSASIYTFIGLTILFFLLTSYIFFIFLLISLYIVKPLDTYLKKRIISQAKDKISSAPHLKIIGIAGSYGKTTMKELLTTILSQKYKVVRTPQNINTPIGISRVILNDIHDNTEIFIMEMGEYYKGDIEALCKIAKPHIAIVTGINEAHIERMGSIETTISTIFEVVENMKENGIILLNGDDKHVKNNYEKYLKNQKTIIYSSDRKLEDIEIKNIKFEEDASGISFSLTQRGLDLGVLKIGVLGEYIIANVLGAVKLAEKLGLSVKEITEGIVNMKPVPHRLEPIFNHNTKVLVIDDSYNGNPQGVEEAVKLLGHFDQRRRIYVTPGLVESGEKAREIHYNIGKKLSKVAGLVILIRNSVTPYIAEGLEENGFNKENILWFDSAKEAHANLGKVLRPYDVILFQNDWPDNYL